RVISEETSKEIRQALESVVARGSGGKAFVDSYRIGGKTGTAQKAQNGRYLENNHIVSFMGFAPADDPQIVVYVAVDNPKGGLIFGGTISAPIVGNILEDSLRAMGVKPRKGQIEKELKWPDVPLITLPDFVGMTKNDIREQLINLQIDASGEGEVVLRQSPEPGAKVKEGSKIRLYFGEDE
ncbi:MAG: stage sporulation protein, partial [Neobacillus sp.]|nr:stage sporulation protein [Neobacillus sp.]